MRRVSKRADATGLLALSLLASVGAHAALPLLTRVSGLTITPGSGRCRVGEVVRLEAIFHTPLGPINGPTAAAEWELEVGAAGLIRHLGEGRFRCDGVGSARVRARADGGEAVATLEVVPGVIAVDLPPPAPEPPPAPLPPPSPPRVQARARRPVRPENPAPPPPVVPDPPTPEDEPPPPPEAARATEVLTADPSPAGQEPTTTAVSGAGTGTSGSGTVAAGGTAAVGAKGAVAGGVPGGTGARPAPPRLIRPARLLDPDACQDHFPADTDHDTGVVDVATEVAPDGRALAVDILREQPAGQGFGAAVRSCFRHIRFAPALDEQGRPAIARVRLSFRFVR